MQTLVIDLAGFDFAQNAVDRELITVKAVDMFLQLRQAREHGLDFELRIDHGTQLVERDDIEHVRHRHHQHLPFDIKCDRQQILAARKFFRHQAHCFYIRSHAGQIHALLADGVGHDIANHGFGDEAQQHHLPAQRQFAAFLLDQRDAQLVLRDQPLLNQQIAQAQFFSLFGHFEYVSK